MKTSLWLAFLFSIILVGVKAQNLYADSLVRSLKTSREDSEKVKTLNELAWEFSSTDLKRAAGYCNQSIILATKLNYFKGRSSAYNTLGNIASDEGKLNDALKAYRLALKDKETINDKKGIATINSNIGIVCRTQGKFSEALKYYTTALTIRREMNNKQGVADCYNNMANVYKDLLQYEEAIALMEKSIELKKETGDKKGIGVTYNNIATIYDDKGDYNKALEFNYKSASILEEVNDLNSLVLLYNNIGILNQKLGSYANAIKYGKMALVLAEKVGNVSFTGNIYANMGEACLDVKKTAEAKMYFEKGLAISKETGGKDDEARIYQGLGKCSELINDYKSAEKYTLLGIKIAREIGKPRDIARYSNSLAMLYVAMKKNEEALKLLEESVEICRKNGLDADLRKAYLGYAKLYEQNYNDPVKAIAFYKLYGKLNDSLFSENVVLKFAQQQTAYETEKKETEIKILRQREEISFLQLAEEKLKTQKRGYLLGASLLLILTLLLGGYFYFSLQKAKSLRIQEALVRKTEENERSRMAKDIHDDLGSGLSKIKFLSEVITAKAVNDPEVLSGARSISETSVNLVENMRDLIWALSPENVTLDSLVSRIREYSVDYFENSAVEISVNVSDDVPATEIRKEAHRNIIYIVKESLQNIIKHAAATSVKMNLVITKDRLEITITDNGKGLSEKINQGNGLRNIKQRAEVIGAKASFISTGEGLEVKLEVGRNAIKKG
ncbi:MAG: ATP-binding protein [Bacteroidia bacterium]